jgi:hypothetical protein
MTDGTQEMEPAKTGDVSLDSIISSAASAQASSPASSSAKGPEEKTQALPQSISASKSPSNYLDEYHVIVTLPPFSKYYDQIAKNPFVHSIRFNSATKTDKSAKEVMKFYKEHADVPGQDKDVWLDLKCRQLRVKKDSMIPDDYMEITHKIKVNTPVDVIFNDGEASATLAEVVDGYKLRFDEDTPKLRFGKGASLNIIHDSFEVEGFFTRKDRQYIKASVKNDMHRYMLSFVEDEKDIEEILEKDPSAEIVAKIESKKGLEFVRNSYHKYKDRVRLMAATGDFYVELEQPHRIPYALEEIIKADPKAIVASRILSSCTDPEKMPQFSEILSLKYLLSIGYKNFMLGDEFCPDRFDLDSYTYTKESSLPLRSALGLFESIIMDHYEDEHKVISGDNGVKSAG